MTEKSEKQQVTQDNIVQVIKDYDKKKERLRASLKEWIEYEKTEREFSERATGILVLVRNFFLDYYKTELFAQITVVYLTEVINSLAETRKLYDSLR